MIAKKALDPTAERGPHRAANRAGVDEQLIGEAIGAPNDTGVQQ